MRPCCLTCRRWFLLVGVSDCPFLLGHLWEIANPPAIALRRRPKKTPPPRGQREGSVPAPLHPLWSSTCPEPVASELRQAEPQKVAQLPQLGVGWGRWDGGPLPGPDQDGCMPKFFDGVTLTCFHLFFFIICPDLSPIHDHAH